MKFEPGVRIAIQNRITYYVYPIGLHAKNS